MRRELVLIFWGLGLFLGGCNLRLGIPTPVPTPDIPRVEFSFPPNGSRVIEGTDLAIDLLARDDTIGIGRVELYVDEQLHQEGSPVSAGAVPVFAVRLNWFAQGLGNHPLTAVAYRLDGTASDRTTIVIQVLPRERVP